MKAWLLWAILSALLGAALIVISSQLLRSIPTPIVGLARGIGIAGLSVILLTTAYQTRNVAEIVNANFVGLLVLAIVSAGSILSFYAALKAAHNEVSDEIVTAINYSSLVLIAVLNILIGREIFSAQTLIGVTLVFSGLAVLAVR